MKNFQIADTDADTDMTFFQKIADTDLCASTDLW